jgi:hypothetical protein
MKTYSFVVFILAALIMYTALPACNGNAAEQNEQQPLEDSINKQVRKPPALLQDTLLIDGPAAVLYQPDSIQLQLMKKRLKPMQYESNMHEFYYQQRNARIAINKNWPNLAVLEAKGYRYLLFKKNSGSVCMDLDSLADPYGLIIFNVEKDPVAVDMTNVETGISFYLQ